MSAGSPGPQPGRLERYREFEQCDGAVDAAWILHAQACSGEELDALAEAQQYVIARTESLEGTERVRIVRAEGAFSPVEVERMERFLAEAITGNFVAAMVESAQRSGKVVVDDPLGPGTASSDCSILSANIVFLRFTGGREPFYVVQHNFAVEGLYFPLRDCMVHLNDCLMPKFKLRSLFLQVHRGAEQSSGYLRGDRRWDGLLTANDSPFHYFYFQVPGTVIACFGMRDPLPATHALADGFYADVPAMFRLGPATRVHDNAGALQRAMCEERSFVFGTGLRPRIWASPQRYRMIDDVILEYCRRLHADAVAEIANEHDFVLWAGVSSGKRVWTEEVESVIALATELARRFPRVALLVDGWTSTVARRRMPPGYDGDEQALRRICSAVPANVTCVDLVGRDPQFKIALAAVVDFFVCSHGTASMYVARIARRRGLSHVSNAARGAAVEQHVHAETTLVPPGMVHDAESATTDKFRVGYSIDSAEFVRLALSLLQSELPDRSQSAPS